MDDIIDLFNNVSLKSESIILRDIVSDDINTIIYCYNNQISSILSQPLKISLLKTSWPFRKNFFETFQDESHFYRFINRIIWKRIPIYEFTEICPLLDEYIEYAFSFAIL